MTPADEIAGASRWRIFDNFRSKKAEFKNIKPKGSKGKSWIV